MQCMHSNISIIIEKRKQLTRQRTTTLTELRANVTTRRKHYWRTHTHPSVLIIWWLRFRWFEILVWFGRGLTVLLLLITSHQFLADLFAPDQPQDIRNNFIQMFRYKSKWKPVFQCISLWWWWFDCCHINVLLVVVVFFSALFLENSQRHVSYLHTKKTHSALHKRTHNNRQYNTMVVVNGMVFIFLN